MTKEFKDNSGVLFKNEVLKSGTHPLYSGSALIDGVEYFMDSWVRQSAAGKNFMSFSFKKKTKQRELPGSPASDDEIPF